MVMESKLMGQLTPKLSYVIIVGQNRLLQVCYKMFLQASCNATESIKMLQEVGREGL